MLPRGGGDRRVPSLVKVTLGKEGVQGPGRSPAPHCLVRANLLKHFLGAPWRVETSLFFPSYEGLP